MGEEPRASRRDFLAAATWAIGVVMGAGLGVLSALKHNTWLDSLSMALALVGVSMPIFWFGLLLIFFFSVQLQWFPSIGQGGLNHLVLPAFALGLISSATLARLIRSSMLEVLSQDYIRTARAYGLKERFIVYIYALKNAIGPTLTVIGLTFAFAITGTFFVEIIFNWPGLGLFTVRSLLNLDYPAIMGITLFGAK